MRNPGDPIPDSNAHLRIPGTGVDYPVYFDRIPTVGEFVTGPDGLGPVRVGKVVWQFEAGFAFPPTPTVIAEEPAEAGSRTTDKPDG